MTRILIVETASAKRVSFQAEQILNAGVYPDPEIALLCREINRSAFVKLPRTEVHTYSAETRRRTINLLNQKKFDVVFVFWTGEIQYRRMKLLALRLKARETLIISGDGNEFRLTWKAILRHAVFRWRHPLPSDHWDFSRTPETRDRILIIQSADPVYILQALDRLKQKPLFTNPRYFLFCRNKQEVAKSLHGHPMIEQVITHSETRGSLQHLRNLRRMEFDGSVLFLTGDPSYRKIKLFAFLLNVPLRRMLIFNETLDCFFFNTGQGVALALHRMLAQPPSGSWSRWTDSLQFLLSFAIKSALLPFRFVWLHLVWLRLRIAGMRSLRKNHDYSL
jgi:hypothetical protein